MATLQSLLLEQRRVTQAIDNYDLEVAAQNEQHAEILTRLARNLEANKRRQGELAKQIEAAELAQQVSTT